jgi:hypothetical protein
MKSTTIQILGLFTFTSERNTKARDSDSWFDSSPTEEPNRRGFLSYPRHLRPEIRMMPETLIQRINKFQNNGLAK